MDKITILQALVSLATATLGVIRPIYKFLKSKGVRKRAYYDTLLKPFVAAYKKNPSLNVIDFVNQKVNRDSDDIPKYVFYLLDQQIVDDTNISVLEANENLMKVLIHDYLDLYPNEYNKKRSFLEGFNPFACQLMLIAGILLAFLGTVAFSSQLLLLFTYFIKWSCPPSQDWLILAIGVALIALGWILTSRSDRLSQDMYTVKKERILKSIESKICRYDKRHNDFVF